MTRVAHDRQLIPAWRSLRVGAADPSRIEVLKDEDRGTAVYRLSGVGSAGERIVAKRSRRATSLVERTVYEELLPRLPLSGPRYHGFVDEPDSDFSWLFVGDVGGHKYRAHHPIDRAAVARWLGTMNVHASGIAAAARMPGRGSDHYLQLLRWSREGLATMLRDPRLVENDRELLAKVIGHCDALESRWDELARACACLPDTLVHGDFVDHNVYLRNDEQDRIRVLPVDWEKAGWGVSAEDISSVDVDGYFRTVRDHWPDLRLRDVRLAAQAGRIFRCLVYLDWIVPRLASDDVQQRLDEVRHCESWLHDTIRLEVWKHEPGGGAASVACTAQDELDLLRGALQPAIRRQFGAKTSIAAIEREPARYVSSYPCEIVTVRLDRGKSVRLLLKDFSSSQRTKDAPALRRERELRVYRDLLSEERLGAPRFYGSVWSETEKRFWLLLEWVDGLIVQQGDHANERRAAAWLGRMQGHFLKRTAQLLGSEFLIRQDADFFRSKSEAALRDAGTISPAAARRLARIVDGYEPAVALMTALPRTLVHGAYIPWHILADTGQRPVRICVVDWELAACGPTLFDLAFLTDGVEREQRRPIWNAYREEAERYHVPVPDDSELPRIVDCFCMHRIFDWLSRGVEKQFPEHKVVRLTRELEKLERRVLG